MLNVNQILHECKRKPSMHVVDKVRYMILYKAKLEAFREKLPTHRESICVMQELIESQSPSERRASTVKLCELVENQERQQIKDEEYDRAQKEVVKIFERRHSSIEKDRHLSATEMLQQLEDDLVAKGVSREQAGKQLLPLTNVLKLHPFPTALGQPAEVQRPTFKLDVFEFTCRSGDNSHESKTEEFSEVD
jgi:glutamine synthetase adenylyltransferase